MRTTFQLGLLILLMPWLRAQVLFSPLEVIGTDLGEFPAQPLIGPNGEDIRRDYWNLTNLVNQSGLMGQFHSGFIGTNYFINPTMSLSTNREPFIWKSTSLTNHTLPGFVDIDLGTNLNLIQVVIWNVSVRQISLLLRSSLTEPFDLLAGYELTDRTHVTTTQRLPADILTLPVERTGRYLRIQIESVYPLINQTIPEFAILNEVAVVASGQVVPTVRIVRGADNEVIVQWTGLLLRSFEQIQGPYVNGFYSYPSGGMPGLRYGQQTVPGYQGPISFFRSE